jgi:hypothetical protein
MQQIASQQASAEIPINENFQTLGFSRVYGLRQPATSALTWGYYGGRWGGFLIADGTLTLTNGQVNRVVVARSTGVISTSTNDTNWNDTGAYARVYRLTTAGSVVTATEDHRAGQNGVFGMAVPGRETISTSAAHTFALADMRVTRLHPSADTTARTWTIPANSAVAFPIGAELEMVNLNAAGVITVAITTDTMRLTPGGTTGNRTLAANGWAMAKKVTATEWQIRGSGLT